MGGRGRNGRDRPVSVSGWEVSYLNLPYVLVIEEEGGPDVEGMFFRLHIHLALLERLFPI